MEKKPITSRMIDEDLLLFKDLTEFISVDYAKRRPHEVDVCSKGSDSSLFEVNRGKNSLCLPDDDEVFIDCVNEFPSVDLSEKFNHGVDVVSEIDYEHIEASQVSESSYLTEIPNNTSFSEFREICVGDVSASVDNGTPESAAWLDEELSSLNDELARNHRNRIGNSPVLASEKDGGDANTIESSFLDQIGELLMQAAVFQLDLIIGLVSSPSSSLHLLDAFVKNPLGTMVSGRDYFLRKSTEFRAVILKKLSFSVSDLKEENGSVLKISFGLGKALFFSVFACVFMSCLLAMSFVLSYLTAGIIVVEPVQIKEELHFDFTQSSPVAFVPVVSSRVISPYERFLITVSMSLPESDYNRNLGVFQTKVEQMGAEGEVIAASSRPTMLPFRSEVIRLLSSSLRILPVLAGRAVESQTVSLCFTEFKEGVKVPTASMRVTMEPRADLRVGGEGIPEIYTAYFSMESHLPFIQRVLWQWRTVFLLSVGVLYFFMAALLTFLSSLPLLPKLWSARTYPPTPRFVPPSPEFRL